MSFFSSLLLTLTLLGNDQASDTYRIAYFDGACSEPYWTDFSPFLGGSVALGANGIYPIGQPGGEAKHKLKISELDSHTHTYGVRVDGDEVHYLKANTDATGGGEPHQNMQPFYPMISCVQLDSAYLTLAAFDQLQGNVTLLFDQLNELLEENVRLRRQVHDLTQKESNATYFWAWSAANTLLLPCIGLILYVKTKPRRRQPLITN